MSPGAPHPHGEPDSAQPTSPRSPARGWDACFCPLPQGNMVVAQKGSLGKGFSVVSLVHSFVMPNGCPVNDY